MKRPFVDTNVDAILPGEKGPCAPGAAVRPARETRTDRRKAAQLARYVAKKLKKDGRDELYARLHRAAADASGATGGSSAPGLQPTTMLRLERRGRRRERDAPPREEDSADYVYVDYREHARRAAAPAAAADAVVDVHAKARALADADDSSESEHSADESESSADGDAVEDAPEGHWARLAPPERAHPAHVCRPADVQASRASLPVVGEEQRIVDAVMRSAVVFLVGETGSGKTTQVPQFLYEAGFGGAALPGLVAVTQPRRVAAVSAAARVSHELGVPGAVGHHVRHDCAGVGPETRIKFVTDGLLLREVGADMLLRRYSVVVVDEAHERNAATDVLLALLSRAVRLRSRRAAAGGPLPPLRVVVMSATLDVAALRPVFSDGRWAPPVLRVEARQHAVAVRFARDTPEDYVSAAVAAVRRIHEREPPGAVLVFLAGRAEIHRAMAMLGSPVEDCLDDSASDDESFLGDNAASAVGDAPSAESFSLPAIDPAMCPLEDVPAADAALDLGDVVDESSPDGSESDQEEAGDESSGPSDRVSTTNGESSKATRRSLVESTDGAKSTHPPKMRASPAANGGLHVLPLYAALPGEQQMRVFAPPPAGKRLVVLATNVAETSLTIPGVRHVVDAGRAKTRLWSTGGLSSRHVVAWTSRAAAAQRAGRAGRTGPGTCVRLYSAAVFEREFPPHESPEVQRMPADGLVLRLRAMGIARPARFPLPSPPSAAAIDAADARLRLLGATALDESGATVVTGHGRLVAELPLPPVWASLAVRGAERGLLGPALALAAVASAGTPFDECDDASVLSARRRLAGRPPVSDYLHWLGVYARWASRTDAAEAASFASALRVHDRWLSDVHMAVRQLRHEAARLGLGRGAPQPPPCRTRDALVALVAQVHAGCAAERVPGPPGHRQGRRPTYRLADGRLAFLHPASALHRLPPARVLCGEVLERDASDGVSAVLLYVTAAPSSP